MRILLVEDEQQLIDFLKVSLEAEGFAVDTSTDGEKGLFQAQTNEYDLIILDYILPKLDGRQICQKIREEGKTTPIIMLTVKSEISSKVDLLELGVDDYLTKPYSFTELLARIKAVLRRPHTIISQTLQLDDLILDPEKYTIKRGDNDIYLTRKEFALLEFLMRNVGKVLTRAVIMEHVWDMNADPFSNTIESHIMNLRKKIDRNYKTKLLHTIPNRGYKIEVEK
jgi:DNA-binding response OmpR family regulator